jgi:glyoxylase-like metal-dependent hydrolase (beta-lactamase superfamily II)
MMSVRPLTVAPDVAWFAARTPTLPPATHTNSYAIGGRQVLLIEPATPHVDEQAAWLAWAEGLRGSGRELVGIFATHHHPDHIGGATALAEALDLPLWAHATTAALLPHISFKRTLADGERIVLDGPAPQSWEALHTPGHAPGHLCLYESWLGVAIVGDMVASVGTILIDPIEGDLIAYLEQLARLDRLAPALALPAHGDPIQDAPAHFQHYIAHRLRREADVVAALAEHPEGASVDALLPRAYHDTPQHIWPMARLSLESHLIKLEREGRANQGPRGWSPARQSRGFTDT